MPNTFPPSIVKEPVKPSQNGGVPAGALDSIVLQFSTIADDLPPWGQYIGRRDRALREFWPTETTLASAIYGTASRYASFGWQLEGPPRTTKQVRDMLHGVERGKGWIPFTQKLVIDELTQDNGAFAEIVRTRDDEAAPVISLNHLDSNRCVRTGNSEEPVVYYDINGAGHVLKWYQVIVLTEFPSPDENKRGVQYCALTRILRAAQIMRDISIYKREKISGRFTKAVHVISGIKSQTITDAMQQARTETAGEGFIRYVQPVVVGTIDPTATVNAVTLELASLPEGFDEETAMEWYITQMAMAFGTDYQDFAPLRGGNIGSAQQSQVLHLKSRGKGPALFMRHLEHIFNYQGIMPQNVEFTFGEQDIAEQLEVAELRIKRAQARTIRLSAKEISPEVARLIAVDDGDLDPKYLEMLDKWDEEQLQRESELSAQKTNTIPGNTNLGGNDKIPDKNPTNAPNPKAGSSQLGTIQADALAT